MLSKLKKVNMTILMGFVLWFESVGSWVGVLVVFAGMLVINSQQIWVLGLIGWASIAMPNILQRWSVDGLFHGVLRDQ